MSFPARYAGACAQCDEGIKVAELIEFNFDGDVQHVLCPESVSAFGTARPLCPSCFMELPISGRCDCRD